MFKASETIAIFGGSFDPPHVGHQAIVNQAISMLKIDKLIIIPAFLNPFKKSFLATPKQRLEWTRKLFARLPNVIVEDYEICQGKATPTVQTVRHFQKQYVVKYLIIGSDNLAEITKWYDFEWLNETLIWVVVTRAGHTVDTHALKQFELLEIDEKISSTQIREEQNVQQIDSCIRKEVLEVLQQSKD